jgi:ethanolamine ammonia-lyase small subunit
MHDPWQHLRRYTQARIAQGRAGGSLPTAALLEFQLAHAAARDAVLQNWDVDGFAERIKASGLQPVCLQTPVADRTQYLQRPDKGRCLEVASRQYLQVSRQVEADVVLIMSNGLSSTAINTHGLALVTAITAALREKALSFESIYLVPNARVALSDEIGGLLHARLALMIIGERPGLSAADSLGVYLTYAPQSGNTDAERNCISNIRPPEGLFYQAAALKLTYLCTEALRLGYSGVALKDDMPAGLLV